MLRRAKADGEAAEARILVVNDDEAGCEVVSRLLDASGFTAVRTNTHNDALLALNRATESVAAVVIDFTSGAAASNLKLLDSIRHGDEANRECGVIVLAASGSNRLFAFQSGADAFLVRPFHADDLVTEVRTMLERAPDERLRHRAEQLREAQSA